MPHVHVSPVSCVHAAFASQRLIRSQIPAERTKSMTPHENPGWQRNDSRYEYSHMRTCAMCASFHPTSACETTLLRGAPQRAHHLCSRNPRILSILGPLRSRVKPDYTKVLLVYPEQPPRQLQDHGLSGYWIPVASYARYRLSPRGARAAGQRPRLRRPSRGDIAVQAQAQ